MATYSAQDLLDLLHKLEIPALFNEDYARSMVNGDLKLVKQKLALLKKQTKTEMSIVKARWDGRNRYEAAREQEELAPYREVDRLISALEVSLSELEIRGFQGVVPRFGMQLEQNPNTNEWEIVTLRQAIIWRGQEAQRHQQILERALLEGQNNVKQWKGAIVRAKKQAANSAFNYFVAGVVSTAITIGIGAFNILAGIAMTSVVLLVFFASWERYRASKADNRDYLHYLSLSEEQIKNAQTGLYKNQLLLQELKQLYRDAERLDT